ncbi:interferon regulatory factor 3-like isoform X2 [Rhinoderma darwinii]|uniref:interferon regulatory factor 3-like isoform X2 n=1 Tax=Rhinoderma darwinii TaxID=43563 RepID=UPI003F681E02
MSSQKPRIIPWLISQINSNLYPGLEWVNREHTQFRVPWKHGLRQDLSLDDFKIFEAWAIASGCYDPLTEKPDPARWKRNFRSALIRKEGIRMKLDHGSDSVNPHKIYEITIPAQGTIPVEHFNSATANPTSHPVSSDNQEVGTTMKNLFEELELLNLYQDEEELYLPHEDFRGIMEEMNVNKALFAEQTVFNNVTLPPEDLGGAAAAAPFLQEGACAVYSDIPPYAAAGVQDEQVQFQPVQDKENFQHNILKHFSYNSLVTDFKVEIYYRGTLVQTTMVTNPHGFYITAEKQPVQGDYLDRVYLPQPETVVSDTLLVEAVNLLLTKLREGTLVEVREGVICAKRFGQCRSYWSMTNTPKTKIPNMIDKAEYSVLYSIQNFITELIDFVEQRRKESPEYSTWICIGEQWPDDKPWKKKCIMVQVTPVAMRLLHDLSYSTGASSLHNSDINLEISDSLSSTNNLMSLLRSIEGMMDWE